MTKKKSKRLLCLFLSLSLVFAFNVTPAFAADTDTTGEVTVESTTGTDTEDETSSAVGVTINSFVASIGDTEYASLADAFSAAEDGDTITLLQDVSVEESTKSDNGMYQVSGIGVTLDLNANTLTITNKRAFGVLTEGSSLTIKNGTIAYNASGDTTLVITRAGASFSAKDVTFIAASVDEGTTTTSQYLVYAAAGGSVTLTDCAIDNVSNAVVKDNANSATVVLNCCTFSDVTAVSGSNTADDAYTIYFNNDSVLVQDSSNLVKVEDGYTYVVLDGGSVTADSTIYVKEGGKLVLDGGSLSVSVVIRGGGTLEVQSGTVNNDITVESGGILTVSGGTVSGAIANSGTTSISGGTVSGAVTNASDAALTLSDEGVINNTIKTAGTFTMTGGTVSATGLNSDNGAIHVTAGTINISGGTVTAEGDKARAISTASSASIAGSTISGGTFTGSNLALLVQTGTNGLTVTGGTFITSSTGLASIIDRADAICSGYAAYDTTYTVVTASNYYYKSSVGDCTVIVAAEDTTAAATVTAGDTTTYFTSLADAVSAANVASADTTITLLSDIQLDSYVEISNTSYTVTLDLVGYDITRGSSLTAGYLILVDSGASLIVMDSSNDADGSVYSSTYAVDGATYAGYSIWAKGSLTLNSGTLSGYYGVRVSGDAAEFNVNGGAVSGTFYGIYQSSGNSTVNVEDGTVSSSSSYGIYVYGTNASVAVSGGTISGYTRGISVSSNASGSTVTISGGTVEGNATSTYSYGIIQFAGTLNVTGGTISGETYGIQVGSTSSTATADISGGTITVTNYYAICNYGTLKVTGGTVSGNSIGIFSTGTSASVTIGIENALSDDSPVVEATGTDGDAVYSRDGSTVTVYSGTISGGTQGDTSGIVLIGDSTNDTTLYVYGGKISGNAFGICTNGSSTCGKCYIYIHGGEISGAWGMYLPAVDSTTTIEGGTITGSSTGIEIRAGVLNVTGGTITGEGTPSSYEFNGSGTTVIGAGIAISQHTTNETVTVNISGGDISGYYGVFEVNTNANNSSAVTLTVSSDSASSISGTEAAVYSASISGLEDETASGYYTNDYTTFAISGGTYSSQVEYEYCADDYQPTTTKTAADGSTYYTVENKTAVAMISHDDADDVYYDTLSAAVEAASSETEETITIIGAATVTDSMKVSKDVTIDVADGSITIGTAGTTISEVTLTVAEGATVTITASGDGYVANYGTITVSGTLDISALGYTTDTDDAGGLLSGTCGKLSIGANGVFVAPTVWNELWSWNPNMTSATSGSGIFSSAAVGAVVQCNGSEWKCTTEFESTSYDSTITYWSEAMETGVVAKNIDLNSGVIEMNFYIYVADEDWENISSITVAGTSYSLSDLDFDSDAGYYIASQTVAPNRMMYDIEVVITFSDDSDSIEYTTSVRAYVTEAMALDSTTEEQKQIMIAMLNYGAMCQNYYGTKTDDLANSELGEDAVSSYDVKGYAQNISSDFSVSGNGFKLSTIAMRIGSSYTLRLTFSTPSDVDLEYCTISVSNDNWTVTTSGKSLLLSDIGVDELDDSFTVTVSYDGYSKSVTLSGYYYLSEALSTYNDQNSEGDYTYLLYMYCALIDYCNSYTASE